MLSQILGDLGVALVGTGLVLRSRATIATYTVSTLDGYRSANGDRPDADSDRLWYSVEALRAATPDLSADQTVTPGQQQALLVAATIFVMLVVAEPNLTLVVVVGLIIALYFASLVVRLILFMKSLNGHGTVHVTDSMARAVPDGALPSYTILVPAYGEPEVLPNLVTNLRALEYPRDRLEILLLLEDDDVPTVRAAHEVLGETTDITTVLVPAGEPRTKPKALNYGLATSTGQVVTIYDAEDRPEPLQLRKAALALAAAPVDVACVQARLDFFNPTQNLLTRWFTLDYRMWFTQLLPGLSQLGAPIPLGGTSNHFRRETLLEVGAWDALNVTEDADLGVRLHRRGYRTGVVESTTYEEANSDLVNWIKQRSRWYKGYAQTALVHLRHPVDLYRSLGARQFLMFFLFVAGTPLLAILNPIFWTVTIVWFVWHPHVIVAVIPTMTYFVGQICWIAGNLLVLYSWVLSTRDPKEKLWLAAILSPLYWIIMAIAAVKALVQLVTAPSYWEKTQHGLDLGPEATSEDAVA
ncbi:MAG: glycosyltransferase [Actinomycetota bacterium]|nr:glycosyltransferase [Actinomycetota bacterium]MDQ6945199.1 glycosyltransferase [Actinomycetota bacterium]